MGATGRRLTALLVVPATMVMLQLILPKFRPHPVKESSGCGYQAHDTRAPGQGNKFRTDSDRCIYAQNGFSRYDFRVKVQRDTDSNGP